MSQPKGKNKIMSAEYRPIPALQFDAIDKRLKKYGIKVDCVVQSPLSSGHTVLSSPLRRETAPVFPIMTASGFFTRTGQRYQMTIPQGVNIGAIRDALLELAEREGEHSFLHP